ncbi:MAG TPA: hypothetical protein VMD30_12360 [Tepidisphaeraceae bacterium]|nr:hypothetical protein [Tepidisphaeraceae bacterium]
MRHLPGRRTSGRGYLAILSSLLLLFSTLRAWGQSDAPASPATNSAPLGALQGNWDQIDQRLVFLTIELSTTETSLNAINHALVVAGYQKDLKGEAAQQYQQGNEQMDRNGGGPVPWQDFYGKTASAFYYHPSASVSVDATGGREIGTLRAQENGGPLTSIDRPPQLDFIYRANSDAQQRAEADAEKLGQQIDQLLARRRQLESEQSALWYKIAFRAVTSRDLADNPLYAFEPTAPGTDDLSQERAAAISAGTQFMRTMDAEVQQLQRASDDQQSQVYDQLQKSLSDARTKMNRAFLQQKSLALDLLNGQSPLTEFTKAAKRLDDSSQNMVDAYQLAATSDQSGDDSRKMAFRGQLQQAIIDFAQTMLTADQCLSDVASAWKVVPDPARPVAEPVVAALTAAPAGPTAVTATSVATPPPMKLFILDIKATIDGGDSLAITPNGATWTHKSWDWASDIQINGVAWDAKSQPEIGVTGPFAFLSGVDLSTAKVVEKSGRDTVVMESEDNGITIDFSDSPNGSAPYEIKIAMAEKP